MSQNGPVIRRSSPQIAQVSSISSTMLDVIVALLPALGMAVYLFGPRVLALTLVSVAACVGAEYGYRRLMGLSNTVGDLSACVTGLLLAFNLPSNLPIWIVVIGSIVAIGIAKMSFGGLGNNLFNPALAGRVFLLISFPTQMTQWPRPIVSRWNYTDTETGATLLSKLKEEGSQWIEQIDIANLWIGNQGGSLGEVGAIALLIGFAYLLYRKIISWHIPVSILLTVFLFSFVLACGQETGNPQNIPMWQYAFDFALIQLLSGGLLLGAIYMATDYVTSPMTSKGMIIYGIGIGILTVVIRQWGGYPEGVSFAILIMNAFTPLINNYIKPKRFGNHRS